MMKLLVTFVLAFVSLTAVASPTDPLGLLAVQEGGRVKPLDSLARESLKLIYGKEKFEKRPALEIVMTMLLQPDEWDDKEIVELRHAELKKSLKLPVEKNHFSLNTILASDRLSLAFQELASQREAKVKLNGYFQAVQRLESQIFTYKEIVSGELFRLVPPKVDQNALPPKVDAGSDRWMSLTHFPESFQAQFRDMTSTFISGLGAIAGQGGDKKAIEEKLSAQVRAFMDSARAQNPDAYPSEKKLATETHYNRFHPFQWAWVSYLLAALVCFLAWIMQKKGTYSAAWVLAILGLALHTYGFALRVYLTERPPVSNMYETVIWVGWGTVVFSMVIEAIYKWRFILLAGSIVGFFCLALGDMAPVVLDSSLTPLEPVLRSNYWLLVHVLTITISYAAFFLAFALGDLGLAYVLRDEEKHREKIKAIVLAIYRAIQIGVGFLTPGIILGGIWADESWGRFWGWDPKETWALIALLGYLAVMHARLTNLLKDFGMIVTAVVTFSLVIMAWYGVNFVLGAGLHSYGFGAGGVEYVAGFVALHLLYVIFVAAVRSQRAKARR